MCGFLLSQDSVCYGDLEMSAEVLNERDKRLLQRDEERRQRLINTGRLSLGQDIVAESRIQANDARQQELSQYEADLTRERNRQMKKLDATSVNFKSHTIQKIYT